MKFYTLILIFVTAITDLFGQSESIKTRIEKSVRSKVKIISFDYLDHIMQFNRDIFLISGSYQKGANYYDKLFAGELIYKLIEQRIINEMIYKSK